MSHAPKQTCTYPRCSTLVAAGQHRCAQHRRVGDVRANAAARRLYFTARWRELRARVLRQRPWCDECLAAGYGYVSTTDVDHRVPHRGDAVLFYDEKNLHALCKAHHTQKTRRGE